MRIVVTPFGVYVARCFGVATAGYVMTSSLAFAPIGAATGLLIYWGDFRERHATKEGATLKPFRRIATRLFWISIALNLGLYGIVRLILDRFTIGPIEWVSGMTLIGLSTESLRAYGFWRVHRI